MDPRMEESDNEEVLLEEPKSKKRKSNPFEWKRNKVKISKLKGEEHHDYKGRLVPSLSVGENCRCKKLKCFDQITEDEAVEIFKRVHDLPTKNEQDLYIQCLIESHDVKRHRPRKDQPRQVVKMFTYYAYVGNKKTEVCYKAFLALHAVTDKRVKRLRKLALEGKTPKDTRGKGQSANTLPAETRELIRNHIESFPTKVSRYSGKTKLFLDARLSVATMYRMLKEKYPDLKCGYKYFLDYFNENFNLSFGRPQIDTCSTCEELQLKLKSPHLSDNAKRSAAAELLIHKRKSKKFYNALKHEADSKDEPHVISLCMDFMQNVPIPLIPIQDTFYMRQITVNVFCIHNIKENTCMIYIYHEGTANKGPNEVCSFLYDYIKSIPPQFTELRLFADNCGGQNKNHTLTRFLLALANRGRFDTVQQFFPIRGHSFLPCDRDFATIKRELKKYDRLYDIATLRNLILRSSRPGKLTVKEVETLEILDFKQWWKTHYKKVCISEETRPRHVPKDNKIHFGISSLMHFIYKKSMPGTVVCSATINSMVQHTFRLAQSGTVPTLPENHAYPAGRVPIKIAKIADIKKLLPYIPDEYRDFYEEIIIWPTTAAEEGDTNVQDD